MTFLMDDGRTVFEIRQAVRRNVIRLIRATPYGQPFYDHMDFFGVYKEEILEYMVYADQDVANTFKCQFFIMARMEKRDGDGNVIRTEDVWFKTTINSYPTNASLPQRDAIFNEAVAEISRQIERYTKEASGWIFSHLIFFDLSLANFNYYGSPGRAPIPPNLPAALASKRRIIKFAGGDKTNCFTEAITVATFQQKNNMTYSEISKRKTYTRWLNLIHNYPNFVFAYYP